MNKKNTLSFIFLALFIMLVSLSSANAEENKNIIKKTRNMAGEARSLAGKGEIDEAVNVFLKISEIYEKLIADEPENKGYKKDYEHYLNQTGQVQLKYAKKMAGKKKYDIAAKYYNSAVISFKSALKRIPKSRIFLQNIEYCLYYGGIAGFTHALENNDLAPDFSIEAIGGGKIELKDFKGKPILLKFWTGWCPECKKNMVIMKEIHKKYSSKGLQIVCITLDKLKHWRKSGSEKKAEEMAKKLMFKSGWGTKDIYYRYGIFRSVPTLILLDKNLNIVKKIPSKDRTIEKLSLEIEKLL